jgi:hypothetical protein
MEAQCVDLTSLYAIPCGKRRERGRALTSSKLQLMLFRVAPPLRLQSNGNSLPRKTRDPEARRRGTRGSSKTYEVLSDGGGRGSSRPAIAAILGKFNSNVRERGHRRALKGKT